MEINTLGKVDLIYTWVDGSWPGYLEERRKHAREPLDMNPERYRDIHESLRYSLRSAHMYVPWVENIYVVTNRPQVPVWLDTDNPRVRLVHLDQFIPEQHLPTFNSNVIESYLHELPGLNQHFISMCDDYFFLRETSLSLFWNKGKYSIFGSLIGENIKRRVYFHSMLGLGFIEHGPLFASKEFWREMAELLPVEMEISRSHKFRGPNDLVTFKLYRRYMLSKQRKLSYAMPYWKYKKFFSFNMIENNPEKVRARLANILNSKPNAFCLNDDQEEIPDSEVVHMIQEFLSSQYPTRSPFEKLKPSADCATWPPS